ncbi:MAG: RNA polymerase sigma factor [Pleurocapsa minor GSE-CHR-MK-17-07R]|jgi:RNA polymerase sigma-70 factor (ECF subfamily)|nr:RNA polymerase sigma factor [Pleurocapsa minor GSE-CHR-MK 17-07R]
MILLVLPDVTADEDTLSRARAGDEEAIVAIYHHYFDPVYQFCRLRVGDTHAVQDLTSEVFVRFIRALKKDKAPHTSLRAWIFRVARNLIYDHYGRREAELPESTLEQWVSTDMSTDPETEALRRIQSARARRAIAMLAPAQQEVLLLRFDQQLSLQETADIMDKQVNAIKALQFRAVNTLRQILAELETEDS